MACCALAVELWSSGAFFVEFILHDAFVDERAGFVPAAFLVSFLGVV